MKQRYIAALLAEALGTFVLVLVVLNVSRYGLPFFTAIAAGVSVAVFVSAFGKVSGGHFNPAVSLGLFSIRQISFVKTFGYIVAQCVAAVGAWQLYEYFTQRPLKNTTTSFDWRIFLAEAAGTLVFMLGVTAAVTQAQKGWQKAATIGSALFLGITVAGLASNGICNPAVALGVRSFDLNYFLGPIVGGVVAALLSAYVIYPIFGSKNAGTVAAAPVAVKPGTSAKPTTVKAAVVKPAPTKAPAKKAAAKPAAKKAPAKKTAKK